MAAPSEPDPLEPRRAADPFDWEGALALIRRAFAGMEGRIDPPSSIHRYGVAEMKRGEFWVIGKPPLACVQLTPRAEALYVGKLAVAPERRRQGLARRLMALAEARARALGLPAVELKARVELTENHATFRALGYVEAGRSAHPGFDRPTSIIFRKDL